MANDIKLFEKYIAELDEVYKLESITAVLDSADSKTVQMTNAGSFKVPVMTVTGLADYDKAGGYKTGAASITYEEKKPTYDRGEKLMVDAEDNADTAGLAFGKLGAEFLRVSVVPEIDAVRLAAYAGAAGGKKQEALTTGADAIAAISAAITAMEENEVTGTKYLYIRPGLLRAIKDLDTTKSKEVLEEFAQVIKAPAARFNTEITTKDGSTEEGFGFEATGNPINFMIVEKSALCQTTKHLVTKVFAPSENQDADAWAFCYRNKGICDVYDSKSAGVYVSYGAKASE